jgi:hypothetical protein
MNLKKSIMEKNPCYTSGRKIEVRGLMLHSVGCPQPSASAFINNWNSPSYGSACVHAFIDGNDGTVYQTLPWNHRGWHCGAGNNGSANNTHIGVEMCEPATISYVGGATFTVKNKADAQAVAKRTYKAAVELFAYLCKEYKLDPLKSGVIISHKEGSSRGIASNHGDPEHLWKQLELPYTMDTFRNAVMKKMADETNGTTDKDVDKDTDKSNTSVSDNTTTNTTDSKKKITNSECPIVVRVEIDNLNIRKGPGADYDKTGTYTGIGAFTITEVREGKGSKSGWGKLASGAGWISLDYCTPT